MLTRTWPRRPVPCVRGGHALGAHAPHLRAEIERNYPVETELRGGTDLSRVLASRRILGPRFLLWTSLLSIPMLLMTLLLFVAFPRVGLGFIGRSSQRGQHVSGFGDNVRLGGFGLIRDDPTVVVRVSAGRPLTVVEQERVLRLRGTAFDHYDGQTWTRSADEPSACRRSVTTTRAACSSKTIWCSRWC